MATRRKLAHVFQNLLSSPLKYRKKEASPEIHISAQIKGEECVICVRDNGIGFEQRYAERIFGLFKRLHKEEYPGTGLRVSHMPAHYRALWWSKCGLKERLKRERSFTCPFPCIPEE